MDTTTRTRRDDRARAMARLRSLTIGTALAGTAATLGLGLFVAGTTVSAGTTITDAEARGRRQARPRARSMRRPSTRSPSARSPLWTNSLVIHGRRPRIAAAVSSAKARSTYRSST